MPRRREVPKRELIPDPKYKDVTVSRFINGLISRGKKGLAERIVYNALEIVESKTKEPPLKVPIRVSRLRCAGWFSLQSHAAAKAWKTNLRRNSWKLHGIKARR
jgi:hypothetical protein